MVADQDQPLDKPENVLVKTMIGMISGVGPVRAEALLEGVLFCDLNDVGLSHSVLRSLYSMTILLVSPAARANRTLGRPSGADPPSCSSPF